MMWIVIIQIAIIGEYLLDRHLPGVFILDADEDAYRLFVLILNGIFYQCHITLLAYKTSLFSYYGYRSEYYLSPAKIAIIGVIVLIGKEQWALDYKNPAKAATDEVAAFDCEKSL
jgi:hypothetical protein